MLGAALCAALALTAQVPARASLAVELQDPSISRPGDVTVGPPSGNTDLQSTSAGDGINASTVATTPDGSTATTATAQTVAASGAGTGPISNYILGRAIKFWHAVAVKAQLEDYSHEGMEPEQNGPCYTSRISAMVHIAIHDAYVGVSKEGETYLSYSEGPQYRTQTSSSGDGSGGGSSSGNSGSSRRRLLTWGRGGHNGSGTSRSWGYRSSGGSWSWSRSTWVCAWGWGCQRSGNTSGHGSWGPGSHSWGRDRWGQQADHQEGSDGGYEAPHSPPPHSPPPHSLPPHSPPYSPPHSPPASPPHSPPHPPPPSHSPPHSPPYSPPHSPPPHSPPPPAHHDEHEKKDKKYYKKKKHDKKPDPRSDGAKKLGKHAQHTTDGSGSGQLASEFIKIRVAYAAIGQAAYDVIGHGYPRQKESLKKTLDEYLQAFFSLPEGTEWGCTVSRAVIAARAGDGHDAGPMFADFPPGPYKVFEHQPDPFVHPTQPLYAPHWGEVAPFGFGNMARDVMQMPQPLKLSYPEDYKTVKRIGRNVSATRTDDETSIGLMWAYDGSYKIGTPIRLFNQVIDAMVAGAEEQGVAGNVTGSAYGLAKLYACTNVAMADAAIDAWRNKYSFNFWRPVIGIRWGHNDTYPSTKRGRHWEPLGSPLTNTVLMSVTPAFPSYPSGHATIGTAGMMAASDMLGLADDFRFSWVSSEMDGEARNQDGSPRPRIEQYLTPAEAMEQNKVSRVYLGVHWHFDCVMGAEVGEDIAHKLAARFPARA